MKVEGVATISLDLLPLDEGAEFLSRSHQFDRDRLLVGADENDYVTPFVQPRKIHLLHIFEINEQEFLSQRCLARLRFDAQRARSADERRRREVGWSVRLGNKVCEVTLRRSGYDVRKHLQN